MGSFALLGAWILSVLPFFAEALGGGPSIEGASRFGLALLPWAALAGLPPAAAGSKSAPRPVAILGLALPPLGLGLGLDAARGALPLATTAAAGVLLLVLLVAAAHAARRSGRARRLHAVLWFVAVPLGAALWLSLEWAASGAVGETAPLAARAAPLVWIHGWTAAGSALPTPLAALPSLAVLGGILGATLAAGKAPADAALERRA